MKNFIALICLLVLSTVNSFSQKIDTIYYDKNDRIASPKKFNYYRVARQDSLMIKVFDFDKSGKLIMSGGFKSHDFKDEVGPFYFYKKNRIVQIEIYQPSKYPEIYSKYSNLLENIPQQSDSLKLLVNLYKNKRVRTIGYVSDCCAAYGPWFYLNKDGEPTNLISYSNNKLNGPFQWYHKSKLAIKGYYKDGRKDGTWQFIFDNGDIYKTIIFHAGKKIKTIREM